MKLRSSLLTLLRQRGGGVVYDSDAQAYFDVVSPQLSTARKELIETFVIALRTAMGVGSLADAYDRIWLFANETENSGLVSLVNPSADIAVNIHATAFTVDRGFKGDGVNDYIDSKWNGVDDGVVATLDSTSIAVYSRTNVSLDEVEIGSEDSSILYISCRRANNIQGSVNQSNVTETGVANSLGFYLITRRANNDLEFYIDGSSVGQTGGAPSTNMNDIDMYICGMNWVTDNFFSTKEIALALVMKGATDQQSSDIYDAVQVYMTAVGAQVTH